MTADNSKLQTELDDTLEKVLEDAMILHYDSQSGESFQECVICEGWDEHDSNCPIPAIDKWINTNNPMEGMK